MRLIVRLLIHLQVEAKLALRLQYGIQSWVEALELEGKQDDDLDLSMDTDAPVQAAHKPGGEPKFKVSVHKFYFCDTVIRCHKLINSASYDKLACYNEAFLIK